MESAVDPFEERVKQLAKATVNSKGSTGLDLGSSETEDSTFEERAGNMIGPYKLMSVVGEGGMGTVWSASQEKPIKRVVAIKIIKAGMDTKEVIARFESERQALAIMDHPGIARVFDAGATKRGRPYFAMELVKGIPITIYCNNSKASTEQRLRLFCKVCDAIQHAHRKGVIHRDIKPSNILVTLDGKDPEIKVIDFGLAKATNHSLTDKSLFTQIGQLVGTPAYMSPEQAESTSADVDTRTDIYSLGVLLYELLTGGTPFDLTKNLAAGYDEMRRAIRDVDPPVPSTRLSSVCQESDVVATQRATNSRNLIQQVRGDLDVIVMKSLEKDRSRRYDNPTEFSKDIQRFLNCEPVLARSPTLGYRLKRLYQRNRIAFVSAILIFVSILTGSITSVVMAFRATWAAELAEQRLVDVEEEKENVKAALAESESARLKAEQVSQLLVDIFESPDPSRQGHEITIAEMLDRASIKLKAELSEQPERQNNLKLVIADTYIALGLNEKARPLLEDVVDFRLENSGAENEETIAAQVSFTNCLVKLKKYDLAIQICQSMVTNATKLHGPDHRYTLVARNNLATALWRGGNAKNNREEVLEIRQDILARAKTSLGPADSSTLVFSNNLANSYTQLGRHQEALELRQEVLKQYRKQFGNQSPRTIISLRLLVTGLRKNNKDSAAVTLAEEAASLSLSVLGEEHKTTIYNLSVYADLLWETGKLSEATEVLEQLLSIRRRIEGFGSVKVQKLAVDLIQKYGAAQHHEKAILLGQEVVAHLKRTLPDGFNLKEVVSALVQSVTWNSGANESQLNSAKEILDDFQKNQPQVRALALNGALQFRTQQYEMARATLKKAVRNNPKDPVLKYLLAMSLWQSNEQAAAREVFAKAEELLGKRSDVPTVLRALQNEARELIVEQE